MKRWIAAAMLTAGMSPSPMPAAESDTPALPFDALIVFGDSLSDAGNAGGAPYSDGAVWVERLAEPLGLRAEPSDAGGTNFAFAGAWTHGSDTSLRAQADEFLRSLPAEGADLRALYVVWGGGNDLRGALGATDPHAVVANAVAALGGIIGDLAAAGAVEFLVPNLPDLGRVPAFRRDDPAAAEAASALAAAFNKGLERILRRLEASGGGEIRIRRLDVFRLLEEVVADPEAAGFDDIAEPCLPRGGSGRLEGCDEPDRFLFWDGLHPTAAAHARLAEAALRVLR
jgi:cholinesterase